MSNGVGALTKRFAELCGIKSATTGRISGVRECLSIWSEWSFRSIELKKNVRSAANIVVNGKDLKVIAALHSPTLQTEGQYTAFNADSSIGACVITNNDEKDKKQFLRLFDSSGGEKKIIPLTNAKQYGKVHTGGDFGGLAFSPNGRFVLFTAERRSLGVDYFDAKSGEDKEDKPTSTPAEEEPGAKYVWEESFGEQSFEVTNPVLCLLDLETNKVQVLDHAPKTWYPTQKLFSADGNSVFFAAQIVEKHKFGKVFCSNRPYAIGRIDLEPEAKFSPVLEGFTGLDHLRLLSDGKLLAVARKDSHETHQGPYGCFVVDPVDGTKVLIDSDSFFLPALSERCFAPDGDLVFSVFHQHLVKVFRMNLKTGELRTLSPDGVVDTVLDVFDGFVLIARSTATNPPHLVLLRLDDNASVDVAKPNKLTVGHTCEDCFVKDVGTTAFIMLPEGFEAADPGSVPLVTLLHGGPHSSSIRAWPRRVPLMLLEAGFAVLQINYVGSIGYSEQYVTDLPGKIGDADVKDCMRQLDQTLADYPKLSSDHVSLIGGSHGGFLVTHLPGQYPDRFKCVVSLNPVLNLATMFDITDIPDWTFAETGFGSFADFKSVEAIDRKAMFNVSPMAHAHNIRVPYLLAIGGKDLRVPPHFWNLIRLFRENEVKNKVLLYKDSNHALDEPLVEIDVCLNAVQWIQEYGSKTVTQ